jgi:protein-S-isoprenylcysteine O-methyltransferase Ste14
MPVPDWVYRRRNFFVCPPLIFACISVSYETETDGIIWPLGTGIVLVGIVLRIWAQQHLHYRLKGHKQLTTTGPYGFVRNPLYIGNTMMCVGATIASELLWLIPITIFWCIGIYSIVIRYEEEHLLEKYGDAYRKYLSEIARWFPKGQSLRNLGLINEYLYQTVFVELPGVFILLPYVIKEVIHFH